MTIQEKEFNLSEKIRTDGAYQDVYVKEFIKLLKEELDNKRGVWKRGTIKQMIDKLAGSQLTK